MQQAADEPRLPADSDRLGPLREPAFRWFLASRFCSAVALTGLSTAVGWHVYDLSRSTFDLGLLGAVQFLPALPLTLVGGSVADAFDRRRVVQLTQSVAALGAAALCAATLLGYASVPLLFTIIFVEAVAASFENPSRMALLPLVVSRERFPRAVPIHSTLQALAFTTGPALGGGLIALAGVAAAYAGAALLSLVAVAGFFRVRSRPPEGGRRAVSLQAIGEGLAYVRSQPVVLGCMALDMFAVIFAGATALIPVYATEILKVGPGRYGILAASLEIGAFAMSLLLVLGRPIRRQGSALLFAVAAFGIFTIAFGLSRSFWLSVALYALAGAADQVSVVMRSTIVQLTTPDVLRGRVSSINMIFIGASNRLGAMESGFLAALTSATFSVVFGGVACLAVVGAIAARVPSLRRYRLT
jgi:MFS family permease